ncbi:unnamed protein product [Triticum turgidum subsp. durum]|uniref:Ubiquitin-like protease family profile domain-containing protein n=1 Tax=Triticum turgidum subsp. durum TaxID=4567 RepID=A0A9R0RUW9_TRITD|nr:unnamed protein product [Triticum turgidum subsp. durum]
MPRQSQKACNQENIVIDLDGDDSSDQEREELEQFINEVELEFPKVPQQSGVDCGMYVLYFVYCFLTIKKLGEDLSHLVYVIRFKLYTTFLFVPHKVLY